MPKPVAPGKSLAVLGPSGSGKSHLMMTALQSLGSGIVCLAPGQDEIESYARLYSQATVAEWDVMDGVAFDRDAPYVLAPFDDSDFAPSLGREGLHADAVQRLVRFLRLVRKIVNEDREAGRPPRWACVIQDTFSGIGDLAINAMYASMGITEPPKARGDGGSTFYVGISTHLGDVARATRVLRGYGMHWLATSHVSAREASSTFKATELGGKEQHLPLITGSFRERFTPMFDIALFAGIDSKGKHYVLSKPDMRRQAKARYGLLNGGASMVNDWDTIMDHVTRAESPLDSAPSTPKA